ncbi:MAG: PepSY domain-containing protein [Nitrospira sp.]|nr:MAG: PepSY domain-containing protein [Nitrospira sp.]
MTTIERPVSPQPWLDDRAVWRWHFYAGLFSIPFIVVLAISGAIYLFKPQVEAWLDRPYDHLALTGRPSGAEVQVRAALAAVPGATLAAYEVPTAPEAAVRVIVKRDDARIRVYVHPETLGVLQTLREDDRLMRIIFRLHGQLLMQENVGSAVVETAASWTIIMIVTGLYLWWPRAQRGWGGILYPRLARGSRLFWRDWHAVTGFWIAGLTLFLLLTGLPWAKLWGGYFKEVRRLTGTAVVRQDETGDPARPPKTTVASGEHGGHGGPSKTTRGANEMPPDYAVLDRVLDTVRPLRLAPPVLISPPAKGAGNWTAKSDAQNRPLRVNLVLDGATGAVLTRQDFKDRHVLDRVVGIGVAAHEGQLFGWPNQVLGALTAGGLLVLVASSVIMWWRRRPPGALGAPETSRPPRRSWGLGVLILLFGLYLPLFAASLLLVLLAEQFLLRRIPVARKWLGLT